MKKTRILAVNDNPNALDLLAVQLNKSGYAVERAASGAEALEIISERKPDLIVTDIHMADIDGFQFCRMMKSDPNPEINAIPIVFLSATYQDVNAEEIALNLGADAFVQVPYRREDLIEKIRSALKQAGLFEGKTARFARVEKILVVCDDPPLIGRMTEALSLRNWRTSVVEKMEDAVRAAGLEEGAGLAVVDRNVGSADGLEICRRLKEARPDLTVLLMSAFGGEKFGLEALRAGVDDFIEKPMEPDRLIESVDLAFRKRNIFSISRQFKIRIASMERMEALYRSVFSNAGAGLVLLDAEGKTADVNAAFEKAFGRNGAAMKGKPFAEDPDAVAAGLSGAVQKGVRGEGFEEPEVCFPATEGRAEQWARATGTPIVEGGKAAGLIAAFHLFTDRRRLEDDLHETSETLGRAYDELKSFDLYKTRVMQNVTHELKTPVVSIAGYVDMLMDEQFGPLTPDQKDAMGAMRQNLVRALDRIGRLEAYSKKLEVPAEETEINLARLTVDCLKSMEPMILEKNLQLDLDLEWRVWVRGDESRLYQAIENLIANAVKFSPRGGSVRVELEERLEEKERARLTVSDAGPGVAKEDLPKIFERFYRGKGSEKVEGLGIGLALTEQIARDHGGRVEAGGEEGKGAVFSLILPTLKSGPSQERPGAASVPLAAPAMPEPGGIRFRALVVDDDPDALTFLRVFFKKMNVDMEAYGDGAAALENQRPGTADLALVDIAMPGMDGFEVCQRLLEKDPGLPVYLFTALETNALRQPAERCGAAGLLQKPVKLSRIQDILARTKKRPV